MSTPPPVGKALSVKVNQQAHDSLTALMATGMTLTEAVKLSLHLVGAACREAWEAGIYPDGVFPNFVDPPAGLPEDVLADRNVIIIDEDGVLLQSVPVPVEPQRLVAEHIAQRRARLERAAEPEPAPTDDRYVYFIQAENGLIKIGVSNDPAARIRALQTGSPIELTLLGVVPGAGRQTEAQLHEQFAAHRTRGEWFHPAPQLIAQICHALSQNQCNCSATNVQGGA